MRIKKLILVIILSYIINCSKVKETTVENDKQTGCPIGMDKVENLCVQAIVDYEKTFNLEDGNNFCKKKYSGRVPTALELEKLSKNKKYLDGSKYITDKLGKAAYMYSTSDGGFSIKDHMETYMGRLRCIK
jgi:hypothetical protein